MTPERLKRQSKLLSLALRHNPAVLGLNLDPQGWANVDDVLAGCVRKGQRMSRAELEEVVATNDKQRFSFDEAHARIRANQGHSIPVDLQMEPTTPPDTLYHGTADRNLPSIRKQGLLKGSRLHVHLSTNVDTAVKVGQRYGRPVVLTIDAGAMHRDGYAFYVSANGVWLTDHVPPRYLGESTL